MSQPNAKPTLDSHHFDPTILREYDVRGIVGDTVSPDDAYALGLSFGTLLRRENGKKVVTGYDGRTSSPTLHTELMRGLTDVGCDVINLGLGPTPMVHFGGFHLKADACIIVTGSHNPSDYNGFKFSKFHKPFFGTAIQSLAVHASAGDWDFVSEVGSISDIDIKAAYVDRLLQDLKDIRPLNIAWDAGNGAAGAVLNMLCDKLPGTHTILFDDIDGSFPNHHPDPTVDANLADLQTAVEKNNCDIGIAFDGDGDRIGAITENGDVIRCDMLLTLYAKEVIKHHPKATIIGDVKCSTIMFSEIERLGGTPLMWKTGHSLVKAKMAETNAPLAGELSGHIFFADDYYGYDDALYCAVRLLNILGGDEKPLSDHLKHLPRLAGTPEIRIDVDEKQKFAIMDKLKADLSASFKDAGYKLSTIDGIRLDGPDGWLLLRPSNTQNCLVTRIEARDEVALNALKKRLADALSLAHLELPQ